MTCCELLETLASMGVDEIACLIDFGIDASSVMQSIRRIDEMKRRLRGYCEPAVDYTLAIQGFRHRATMMQCTPSLLRMIVRDTRFREVLGNMRVLMLGGEAIPSTLVKDVADTGVASIFNMYGPTETTIWSAASRLDPGKEQICVGGPILNTQIRILDANLMPVPPGMIGEVYIGGLGLARGYYEQRGLTSERFLPDPFNSALGQRIYRTGDLGRRLSDGSIELLGRSDEQVKIRGHRVELAEVDAAINDVPGVQTAAAVKISENDDERMVAFIIPQTESLDVAVVRTSLKQRLPDYMIPSAFHFVDEFPLTANGKVDRKSLTLISIARTDTSSVKAAPQTNLETGISAIWKDVLGTQQVSIDDNFFDIGGHSLLMVRVHHRLQELMNRPLPLTVLLERPTIRSLAKYFENNEASQGESHLVRAEKQRKALLSVKRHTSLTRLQVSRTSDGHICG
jgi:acyl-CoA synthetase (AMP-forming)/AMP-acid ligase II